MPKEELPVILDTFYEKNLELIKILNNAIFPINFPDSMYKDCLTCKDITQLAYHNDVVVGAILCRCEKQPSGKIRLYIATLGVLAPYRNFGIGGKLLRHALTEAAKDPNIEEAALHVQVGNDDTIAFYKANGFVEAEVVKDYYNKKLDPADAVLLTKSLRS